MTNSESMLQLQLTDTAIDLIRHRMPRLPEVVAAESAATAVREWTRRVDVLNATITEFEFVIATSEESNAGIARKRERLQQQLKTVNAVREAEALTHEIELLNARRSELDDAELEAMEGLASAEAELAEQAAAEEGLRVEAAGAAALAATAQAASNAQLEATTVERDALRAGLDAATVRRYDTMRSQHAGVAIAKLNGLRCEGCHLDLSRGEVDDIKRSASDDLPECPNCGRLLVL